MTAGARASPGSPAMGLMMTVLERAPQGIRTGAPYSRQGKAGQGAPIYLQTPTGNLCAASIPPPSHHPNNMERGHHEDALYGIIFFAAK